MNTPEPLIPEDYLINHLRTPATVGPSLAWQKALTARLRLAETQRQRRRWRLLAGAAALLSLGVGIVMQRGLARLTESLPTPIDLIFDGLAQARALMHIQEPSILLENIHNLVSQPLFYLILAGLLLLEVTSFFILQPSKSDHP
jgi:cobalamin biosynthesis protein CobD/CbiB